MDAGTVADSGFGQMLSYLDCARIYGDMDKETKRKIRNPKRWKELGIELSGHDDITAAFLQTTQAIDLIAGGIKINALPEVSSSPLSRFYCLT